MRTQILFVLISAASCASSPSRTPASEVRTGTIGMTTATSVSNVNTTVAYSVDRVWRVLPGAYSSLGIPIQMLDPKAHQVGNEGFKTRRVLGTTPLSRYIDCGLTQIGPNADSYDVVLTILSQLQSAPNGGTTIVTTVESSARPATYSQEYSRCSSKGVLEARLTDSLVARLDK